MNRLRKGIYQEPNASIPQNNFYNEELTYDVNGNIQTLTRNTKNLVNLAEQIDNLQYSYIGNQLNTVTDSSQNYAGYPDSSGNPMLYDSNGNMTSQNDKGILNIKYNHLNLPNTLTFNENFAVRIGRSSTSVYYVNTQYLYRADGVKLKKIYSSKGELTGDEIYDIKKKFTEYLDGFQYETFQYYAATMVPNPVQVLKFVPTAEGYYNFENNSYIYNYVDHLGNVRLSYFRNGSNSAEVLEENNYYPFGLKHDGYNALAGNPAFRYGYNNKELQIDTGWSDYGARNYMSDIGRWGVVDPFAERYIKASPYHYAFNNPVFFKDPNGKQIVIYYEDERGRKQQYTYSYSSKRESTGIDFLDSTIAALDLLYTSDAMNLDTNDDGVKDVNVMQKLMDDKKILGVVQDDYSSRFSYGISYDKKKDKWNDDMSQIGRIKFNYKNGILFNNNSSEGLVQRYEKGKLITGDKTNSPTSALGHEMIHSYNYLFDNANWFQRRNQKSEVEGFKNQEEYKTTILSNQVNEALQEPQRNVYQGIYVPVKSVDSNEIKK